MELVFENGWYGNQWMGDHMTPRVDVVEDWDAYHFYVEMPGLKDGSIDLQVEDDRLMVASERKRPEWPQEAGGSYRGAALRHYQTHIQASAQREPRRRPRGLC
jgi:HSP20 family molecular chaperone IbpA